MKMKIWLITLPFLFLTGGAMAQATAPDEASAPADAAVSPAKAAKPKVRQRQGGDIRSCLDKADDKAIIRCAERGRKPVHKHARKHAPTPKPVSAPESTPAPKP